MSRLFNDLLSEGLIENWAGLLDWLFDDERFSSQRGWTSGYVGAFTKKVKRISKIGKGNYSYDSIKNLSFPNTKSSSIKMIHAKGDGEARDLVRHIRNGIAHGKTKISKPSINIFDDPIDPTKMRKPRTPITEEEKKEEIKIDSTDDSNLDLDIDGELMSLGED